MGQFYHSLLEEATRQIYAKKKQPRQGKVFNILLILNQLSPRRLVIGKRLSLPKAFGVILTPGGPCRRLYSLASTNLATLLMSAEDKPEILISSDDLSFSIYFNRIGSNKS